MFWDETSVPFFRLLRFFALFSTWIELSRSFSF
jgi:hypothetical protein